MIETFHPQNAELKKYIRYIYLQDNGDQSFTVFPNIGAAITIYENAEFIKSKNEEFIACEAPSFQAILHTMRITPIQITDQGNLKKISIVFHPLGINHFIIKPLCEVVKQFDPSFIPCPLSEVDHLSELLASCIQPLEKVNVIEDWLIRNLTFFSEPILERAIELLINEDENMAINVLCKRLHLHVRTLNRLFAKHICITPVQFRMIRMFRKSLVTKLANDFAEIDKLAIESGFYDSSHLIRVFQKYTGHRPSLFFEKMEAEAFRNYVIIKK